MLCICIIACNIYVILKFMILQRKQIPWTLCDYGRKNDGGFGHIHNIASCRAHQFWHNTSGDDGKNILFVHHNFTATEHKIL